MPWRRDTLGLRFDDDMAHKQLARFVTAIDDSPRVRTSLRPRSHPDCSTQPPTRRYGSSMRRWRCLGLRVVLATLLACGPDEATTTDETAGSTDAAMTSQPTGTGDASTDTGACDLALPPFACEPDQDGGLVTLICAARDEANCNGTIDAQTGGECRWQPTIVYAHNAVTCEDPKIGGACIAFFYSGDGCAAPTACGDATQGTIYYRTDETCQTQMFRHTRCGENLADWNACAWDTPATDACPLPNPSSGPALCNCAC